MTGSAARAEAAPPIVKHPPSGSRRRVSFAVGCTAAVLAAPLAFPAEGGRFTLRATVYQVVDGDTLDVELTNGRGERVRLIGIDTPERGECYSRRATAAARRLAAGKRVVLKGDAT